MTRTRPLTSPWRGRPGSPSGAHWLFTLILVAGLAARVLAEIAYRPALLYIDSVKYPGGSDDS